MQVDRYHSLSRSVRSAIFHAEYVTTSREINQSREVNRKEKDITFLRAVVFRPVGSVPKLYEGVCVCACVRACVCPWVFTLA